MYIGHKIAQIAPQLAFAVPDASGQRYIEIMPEATDRLQLENTWLDDGRLFALWHPHSRAVLQRTRIRLHRELRGKLCIVRAPISRGMVGLRERCVTLHDGSPTTAM